MNLPQLITKIYSYLYRQVFLKNIYVWLYKPVGFYEKVSDYLEKNPNISVKEIDFSKAFYCNVFPAYQSVITNPTYIDFYARCNATNYVIKNKLVETIADNFVLNVPNGRVHTDLGANTAIISHDNRLIGEVSFQYDDKKGSVGVAYNTILHKNIIYPCKYYKGIVFSAIVGGGSNSNYFHWLADTICRFYLLKHIGIWQQIDYFYMPNYSFPFQKQSLAFLGITAEKVINAQEIRHIKADAILCSHIGRPRGHFPKWIWEGLRELFMSHKLGINHDKLELQNNKLTNKFIYISRQDATHRKLQNENELILLLKSYGFEICLLATMDFTTQIALFSAAKIVIAQHGAGLTNIIFCPPKTLVIELYGGLVNPDFAGICQTGNLDHIGFDCDILQNHGEGIHYVENTVVNLEKLEKLLQANQLI